jgi:hypothetical protein
MAAQITAGQLRAAQEIDQRTNAAAGAGAAVRP